MPRRDSERVIVVRTDPSGRILDYDFADPPMRSAVERRSPHVYHTQAMRQPSGVDDTQRSTVYEYEEEGEEEEENVPIIRVPLKKIRRDPSAKETPKLRRVRYVRPKSTVKIFEESVKWNVDSKVDTHNEETAERILRAPKPQVLDEKLSWRAETKIDTHNEEAVEKILRAPKTQVHDEKVFWRAETKIDTHNEELVEKLRRVPRPQIYDERVSWRKETKVDSHNEEVVDQLLRAPKPMVFDEPIYWRAEPKIDTHNEDVVDQIRNAPRPLIYDERLSWPIGPRVDNYNDEYLKYKERKREEDRERATLPQINQNQYLDEERVRRRKARPRIDHYNQEYIDHKEREIAIRKSARSRAQKTISTPRVVRVDRTRIDHHNEEYVQFRERKKSARRPPIEDQKLEWSKTARVNQKNDDYIERLRQQRSIPMIFDEKLTWRTKTPRIDAHNEEYLDQLKEQARPRIVNQLPRWIARPKVDTYNDSFDSNSNMKPVIVNEKLRWNARTKIDTGLEPDPDEDEYIYYDAAT